MGFDRKTFAEYIKKAKGDRSINKFAEECKISAAHISRLLRQLVDTAPSPDTIKNFAVSAQNRVTYGQLMEAAGYFDSKTIKNRIIELNKLFVSLNNSITMREIELHDRSLELEELQKNGIDSELSKSIFSKIESIKDELSVLCQKRALLGRDLLDAERIERDIARNYVSETKEKYDPGIVLDEDVRIIARGMQQLKEESPEKYDLAKKILKTMSDEADKELEE